MGVDTKLIINNTITSHNVAEVLKAMGKEDVKELPTSSYSDYVQITFKSTIYDHNRTLSFFYNGGQEYINIPSNLLSLSSDKESIEVLTELANRFGGVFQSNDCDGCAELFQPKGTGNIEWLLKQYLHKADNIPSNSTDQLKEFMQFVKDENY